MIHTLTGWPIQFYCWLHTHLLLELLLLLESQTSAFVEILKVFSIRKIFRWRRLVFIKKLKITWWFWLFEVRTKLLSRVIPACAIWFEPTTGNSTIFTDFLSSWPFWVATLLLLSFSDIFLKFILLNTALFSLNFPSEFFKNFIFCKNYYFSCLLYHNLFLMFII